MSESLVSERWICSTDWLSAHLCEPDLRIVDGSWYLPGQNRDPRREYAAAHIEGAVFFDLDRIADQSSPLPHMLPAAEQFGAAVGALGIGPQHRVVVYDGAGLQSAPRVGWMFRVFGHRAVQVLDGGLPKWRREGLPLTARPSEHGVESFPARLDLQAVRTVEQMRQNQKSHREQVLDARGAARFAGQAPEPRPGVRSGHIPGSLNLPYSDLIAPDGTLLPPPALRERFRTAGIDLARPVTTTCGSGVTAAILYLALDLLGHAPHALYDGSWAEWGSRQDLPIEPKKLC